MTRGLPGPVGPGDIYEDCAFHLDGDTERRMWERQPGA